MLLHGIEFTNFKLKNLKFYYFKKTLLPIGGRCLKCDLKKVCGLEETIFKCKCKPKYYYKLRSKFIKNSSNK